MSVLDIKRNLAFILAEMSPSLVPITTLSQDAHTGNTTLHLTPLLDSQSRAEFVEGSRVWFQDTLGERSYTLSTVTVDGATATIETSSTLGVTGLQHDHPAGTKLVANVLTYSPWNASPMMALGSPVFSISVYQARSNRDLMPNAGFPVYDVHIQSNRQLQRPDDTVDAESWAQHQEDSTIADLEALAAVLYDNQGLITQNFTAAAESFGTIGSTTDLMVAKYGPVQVSDGGEWHYIGTLDLTVLGVAE